MATMNLRRVDGYVAYTDAPTFNMRRVDGYVAYREFPPGLFKKTGQQALLDSINFANGTNLTLGTTAFGAPQQVDHGSANTQIVLLGKGSIPQRGGKTFYYQRLELEVGVSGKNLSELPVLGATVHESLPAINAKLELALTADDVIDRVIKPTDTQVILMAKSTSIMYLPGSSVALGTPPPTLGQ